MEARDISKRFKVVPIKVSSPIILDDFGLQNLGQKMRLTLLQLPEDRYGKKSIIVISLVPINKWYEFINDLTLADVFLGRLTPNVRRVKLKRNL